MNYALSHISVIIVIMPTYDEASRPASLEGPDQSLKVKAVARILSVTDADVKGMCDAGILVCHWAGPRLDKLRVLQRSVRAVQERIIEGRPPGPEPRRRESPKALEALHTLRKRGLFNKKS